MLSFIYTPIIVNREWFESNHWPGGSFSPKNPSCVQSSSIPSIELHIKMKSFYKRNSTMDFQLNTYKCSKIIGHLKIRHLTDVVFLHLHFILTKGSRITRHHTIRLSLDLQPIVISQFATNQGWTAGKYLFSSVLLNEKCKIKAKKECLSNGTLCLRTSFGPSSTSNAKTNKQTRTIQWFGISTTKWGPLASTHVYLLRYLSSARATWIAHLTRYMVNSQVRWVLMC